MVVPVLEDMFGGSSGLPELTDDIKDIIRSNGYQLKEYPGSYRITKGERMVYLSNKGLYCRVREYRELDPYFYYVPENRDKVAPKGWVESVVKPLDIEVEIYNKILELPSTTGRKLLDALG